jgi:hypothetical protein
LYRDLAPKPVSKEEGRRQKKQGKTKKEEVERRKAEELLPARRRSAIPRFSLCPLAFVLLPS